jgi:hypothetical protein
VDAFSPHVTSVVGTGIAIIAINGIARYADALLAVIVEGAGVPIGAGTINHLVLTTALGQTDVLRAGIAVVTLEVPFPFALPVDTNIFRGAGIVIVAEVFIVGIGTSQLRVAGVVRAGIAVVARQSLIADTLAAITDVDLGTFVIIVAGQLIGDVLAPSLGVARIGGAKVIVITIDVRPGDAGALGAVVPVRAHVIIRTAVDIVGGKLAAQQRVATVVRTRILVITFQSHAPRTVALEALVHGGAKVPVITGLGIEEVGAPRIGCAAIIGAGIAVVAIDRQPGNAIAPLAEVTIGTGIAIVAGYGIGHVETALLLVTTVVGTGVTIVTIEEFDPNALALLAHIHRRTGVSIIARHVVCHGRAPGLGVAKIIGARVPVVAIRGHPARTDAAKAEVSDRTAVGILAGGTIVVRRQATFARKRVTGSGQARHVRSLGLRAVDDGFLVDNTLMWKLLLVANEGTIAQIVIFKSLTILVYLAVAVHRIAGAASGITLIADGARVTVVTIDGVEGEKAFTGLSVTRVVGTKLLVVARHGRAQTDALNTTVGERTQVPVVALAFVEGQGLASGLAITEVFSARVPVITHHTIHLTVTIVIQPVAQVLGGNLGIAGGQPRLAANASTLAGTEFVAYHAGRGGACQDGFIIAGAGLDIGDAGRCGLTGDGRSIQATMASGTVGISGAECAAVAALVAVGDAGSG